MKSWRHLEAALTEALTATLERSTVPIGLVRELEALKRLLGGAGGDRPPRDLLHEAVRRFRDTGELPNLTAARAVCFGSALRLGTTEPPLIEGEVFDQLLRRIDEYLEEPRCFRRCYRGLLHTYFVYDSDAAPDAGQRNWTHLRGYLEQHRGVIRVEGVTPDWVEAIQNHANLLSADPVSKYAPELLEGRTEAVDEFRAKLEIDGNSWLARKLILAQIDSAIAESDDVFRRRVQPLLKVLSGYPVLEDTGLKLILDRYARTRTPELHTGLRDRALESWGSPWLERKREKWSRVSDEARQLITTWLKLDLIREFFEVLSEDRQTDKRRLKFWQAYHNAIDDMYFALGPNVLNSRGADVRTLRDKMADHLLILAAGGGAHNNAFIMRLGQYLVVEFGARGNACFVFDANNLPFRLKGTVEGDSTGLKHASHEHRLLHMDSNNLNWEGKFREVLARRGVRPASVEPRVRPGGRQSESAPIAPKATRAAFLAFLNEHEILWEDKTVKGGNLKVLHGRFAGPIADQLRKWGFSYSERQFWYRQEWP